MSSPQLTPETASTRQIWLFRWLLSGFGVGLLAVTFPLWTRHADVPAIPWLRILCDVPRWADTVCLTGLIAGMILLPLSAGRPLSSRIVSGVAATCLTALLLLDQHRCQPWALQWLLSLVVISLARPTLAIACLQSLTISIYLYSAISKLNWSFCTGLGNSFWLVLWSWVKEPQPWEQTSPTAWPLLFPVGESFAAIGLLIPRFRHWALGLTIVMHSLLLLILGLWGLNHSAGVLLWNLYFIAQNGVLFAVWPQRQLILRATSYVPTAPIRSVPIRSVPIQTASWTDRVAIVVTGIALVWPLGEPWGYCDLWPAWGLYAQHGERLTVHVTQETMNSLPPAWKQTSDMIHSFEDDTTALWRLHPQSVALTVTGAPVYPQNRYQAAVIATILKQNDPKVDQISGTWEGPADRWNGLRPRREVHSLGELERLAAESWWNSQAASSAP